MNSRLTISIVSVLITTAPAPAPWVHPRVLVTPEKVVEIGERVAQGKDAPPEFRTMWRGVRDSLSAFSTLIAQDDALGRARTVRLVERLHTTHREDRTLVYPFASGVMVDFVRVKAPAEFRHTTTNC